MFTTNTSVAIVLECENKSHNCKLYLLNWSLIAVVYKKSNDWY